MGQCSGQKKSLIFSDCGCGCKGKVQEKKFLISLMSALLFFVIANPDYVSYHEKNIWFVGFHTNRLPFDKRSCTPFSSFSTDFLGDDECQKRGV